MCNRKALRLSLITLNAVFLFLSLVLIYNGAWLFFNFMSNLHDSPPQLGDEKLLVIHVSITAMTVGVIAAAVSVLGWFGAAKECKPVLAWFLLLMVIAFIALTIFGVVSISRHRLLNQFVRSTLVADLANNGTGSGLLKLAHRRFNCCGIDDMNTCDQDYPPRNLNGTSVCPKGSTLCQHGCLNEVVENVFLLPYVLGCAVVQFLISCISLVEVLMAAVFISSIKKRDYYVVIE